VPVGAKKAYLTVATYPLKDAFAATSAAAKQQGSVAMKLPNGRVAVYTKKQPTNIHLADRGAIVQARGLRRVTQGSEEARLERTRRPRRLTILLGAAHRLVEPPVR
jgi:hypothetical protein